MRPTNSSLALSSQKKTSPPFRMLTHALLKPVGLPPWSTDNHQGAGPLRIAPQVLEGRQSAVVAFPRLDGPKHQDRGRVPENLKDFIPSRRKPAAGRRRGDVAAQSDGRKRNVRGAAGVDASQPDIEATPDVARYADRAIGLTSDDVQPSPKASPCLPAEPPRASDGQEIVYQDVDRGAPCLPAPYLALVIWQDVRRQVQAEEDVACRHFKGDTARLGAMRRFKKAERDRGVRQPPGGGDGNHNETRWCVLEQFEPKTAHHPLNAGPRVALVNNRNVNKKLARPCRYGQLTSSA